MHLEEVHQLREASGEEGNVSELDHKKGIMGALGSILGDGVIAAIVVLNGASLAIIKLAEVKDSVAILVGIVSMVCTIWMTIYNTKKPK